MQEFRFTTSTQASVEAASIDQALAYALDPSHEDHYVRGSLLTGAAARADLTAEHVHLILNHLPERATSLLATLLVHPVVANDQDLHDRVAIWMRKDDIFTFTHTPFAERLLPLMLSKCYEYGNEDVHLRYLIEQFTPAQIDTAVHALIERWDTALHGSEVGASPGGHTLALRVLGTGHIDRLIAILDDVLAAAATPLPSGRTRRRDGGYESHVNQMSLVEDVLATLLARTDLTDTQSLSLVRLAEKATADAIAYNVPGHRDWIRARYTTRILGKARLSPEATAVAFTSPVFRISRDDITVTSAGIAAALRASDVANPSPILVQRALSSFSSRSEKTVHLLIEMVRTLDARHLPHDAASTEPAETDASEGANTDGEWWHTRSRSVSPRDEVLHGLIRAALGHIGNPAWQAVYTYALDAATQASLSHPAAVDHFVDMVRRAILNFADETATPTSHEFAAWASASSDEYLRRHAVAECWNRPQLVAAAQDPSPLVRVQVLFHDLATADDVLAAALDADADVRLAAASHDLLDERGLTALAADPDPRVRAQAATRMIDALTAPIF